MSVGEVWLEIVSDLFVNLAAGWIGAAFIIPITSKLDKQVSLGLLTMNLVIAIVFLVAAFELRSKL